MPRDIESTPAPRARYHFLPAGVWRAFQKVKAATGLEPSPRVEVTHPHALNDESEQTS